MQWFVRLHPNHVFTDWRSAFSRIWIVPAVKFQVKIMRSIFIFSGNNTDNCQFSIKLMDSIHVRSISITLYASVFMNNIQLKHNYQTMGDSLSSNKLFCWDFTQIFTQTLKDHSSVTNKATEMRQTSTESSICALFNQPVPFLQPVGTAQKPAVNQLSRL